jgi:hypothetical protein
MQPVFKQQIGNHFPAVMVTHAAGEMGCCLRGLRRALIKKGTEATSSVEICKGG